LACEGGGELGGAAGVAGLGSIAAERCGGCARSDGLAAITGFGDGSGTARVATCGPDAGGVP
jgi:hypothetical protein